MENAQQEQEEELGREASARSFAGAAACTLCADQRLSLPTDASLYGWRN